MKILLFNSIVILISLISCKDEPMTLPDKYKLDDNTKTRIEGRVLEYGTNKPLSYANVILKESIYEPGSGGGNYISIDTIQADADGKYFLEFKHLPSTSTYLVSYQIYCKEELYYSDSYDMSEGFGHRHNLILDPFAWINIHIKNINPMNDNDKFSATTDKGGG